MKEYNVFLDVVSPELRLKDLTARIGMEPSDSAHDLGSPRTLKGVWTETVWRLESDAPESASLEDHCRNLLTQARSGGVLETIRHLQGIRAFINIAAFFGTAMCTVTIPDVCLEALRDYPLGLEVACYPADMGSPEPGGHPGPSTERS